MKHKVLPFYKSYTVYNYTLVSPAVCNDGEVKLVNGYSPHDGRVEVCGNGTWGTICAVLWDAHDSAVVCSMLGYPKGVYTCWFN